MADVSLTDSGPSQSMKLLFVDSNRGCWGMEQHMIGLAHGMWQQGHHVEVMLRQGSIVESILHDIPVTVHTVRFGGGGDPRLLARLLRLIYTNRPDWLIANDGKLYWPLLLLGWLAGIRVALFRHQEVS